MQSSSRCAASHCCRYRIALRKPSFARVLRRLPLLSAPCFRHRRRSRTLRRCAASHCCGARIAPPLLARSCALRPLPLLSAPSPRHRRRSRTSLSRRYPALSSKLDFDDKKQRHSHEGSAFVFWRRRRDLNSRAGLNPTYTLSRGASSANLSTSPNTGFFSLSRVPCERRLQNSPYYYIPPLLVCQGLFQKIIRGRFRHHKLRILFKNIEPLSRCVAPRKRF